MATGDFYPNGPGYGPGYGQAYGQPGGYPPPAPGWRQQPARRQKPGRLVRRFGARMLDGLLVGVVAFLLSVFVFSDDYPFW